VKFREISRLCARWVAVSSSLLSPVGCGDDAGNDGPAATGGKASGGGESTGGAAGSPSASEPSPAVMVVGQVYSPDGYFSYVKAFPDVPEGDVDFSTFREFGNANAYAHAGYVFVEEDGILKRFDVSEDNELIDGPSFSWQEFGVPDANASYTVFATDDRAYTLAPQLGVIVVWNPLTMKLTGSIPVELDRPASMETWAYDGHVVGDNVIWNVFSGDFTGLEIHPAMTLVIADRKTDAAVKIIEDSRCLPGGPSRVDDAGDYYVQGTGYFGYFYAYGDAGPDARTCLLRVNAGETDFDPEFSLDFEELTGSYVNEPWIHVEGSQSVAKVWDPNLEIPEDPDLFWDNPAFRPVLLDTEAQTSGPYADFEGWKSVAGNYFTVDRKNYFQLSKTGYAEGGNTDVVEMRPDGVVRKFHLVDGFLIGMQRIR